MYILLIVSCVDIICTKFLFVMMSEECRKMYIKEKDTRVLLQRRCLCDVTENSYHE